MKILMLCSVVLSCIMLEDINAQLPRLNVPGAGQQVVRRYSRRVVVKRSIRSVRRVVRTVRTVRKIRTVTVVNGRRYVMNGPIQSSINIQSKSNKIVVVQNGGGGLPKINVPDAEAAVQREVVNYKTRFADSYCLDYDWVDVQDNADKCASSLESKYGCRAAGSFFTYHATSKLCFSCTNLQVDNNAMVQEAGYTTYQFTKIKVRKEAAQQLKKEEQEEQEEDPEDENADETLDEEFDQAEGLTQEVEPNNDEESIAYVDNGEVTLFNADAQITPMPEEEADLVAAFKFVEDQVQNNDAEIEAEAKEKMDSVEEDEDDDNEEDTDTTYWWITSISIGLVVAILMHLKKKDKMKDDVNKDDLYARFIETELIT